MNHLQHQDSPYSADLSSCTRYRLDAAMKLIDKITTLPKQHATFLRILKDFLPSFDTARFRINI